MDKFEILIRSLEAENVSFMFVGDLNCNLWESPKKGHTKRLVDILDVYQLKQIIQEPTRLTKDTKSLIHLTVTSDADKISSSGVVSLGVSDHYQFGVCLHKDSNEYMSTEIDPIEEF